MTWIFTVEKLDAREEFCACGQHAGFLVTVPPYPGVQTHKFCGQCVASFNLQTLKNEGADLEEIREAFLRLSAAVDALPRTARLM